LQLADGKQIQGIISERDVILGLRSFGREVLDHPVRDLITTDAITGTANDPVAGVMATTDRRQIDMSPCEYWETGRGAQWLAKPDSSRR
jgi:CBS domain-containing protein